ncbi:hypothetical protein MM300_19780 [Evansella sp. LMS18]|jgi:cytochrome bd-type quinol oxidase subunit 2|uniref:hypothetical protein n=1 Tax=Evansella sp. LMS18 TaxID=2924033 RepID=UPI0020D00E8D|nr:hypothetical protein [Evansella sp. LMS18]UTR10092.1 hypothetical protein MM300_19780 [Evansella sp. LMS18]
MSKTAKIIAVITFISFCVFLGISLYSWFLSGILSPSAVLFSFVLLSALINTMNIKSKEEKDKVNSDQRVQNKSAVLGYYVLALSAGLILLISEGTINANEINNYPLLLVVCLALVIQPIAQFFANKNYSQKDTYTRE